LHQDTEVIKVFEFAVFTVLKFYQVVLNDVQLKIISVKFHKLGNGQGAEPLVHGHQKPVVV